MEWQVMLALALGLPIALFPVFYVFYLFVGGGVCGIIRDRRRVKG